MKPNSEQIAKALDRQKKRFQSSGVATVLKQVAKSIQELKAIVN